MHPKAIFSVLGFLLVAVGGLMLLAVVVSLLSGSNDAGILAVTSCLTIITGFALWLPLRAHTSELAVRDGFVIVKDADSGCLRNPDLGLIGLNLNKVHIRLWIRLDQILQVLTVEFPVTLDPTVDHSGIKSDPDVDFSRPILRQESPLYGRYVFVRHADETARG